MQKYANTQDQEIVSEVIYKRLLSCILALPIFVYFGGEFFSYLLLISQTMMVVLSFSTISDDYIMISKKLFKYNLLSIILQMIFILMSFDFNALFIVRAVSYFVTTYIIVTDLQINIVFKRKWFELRVMKKEVELYTASVLYTFTRNIDYIFVSSQFGGEAATYFAVRRLCEVCNVFISWWSMRLPKMFTIQESFIAVVRQPFVLIILTTGIYGVLITIFGFYLEMSLIYFPFIFMPVIFFFDNVLSKYAIYLKKSRTEILKVFITASLLLTAFYFHRPEIEVVPALYAIIQIMGFVAYLNIRKH